MIRSIIILAALIAAPATAQTITVAKPFADANKDGRIDFGTANRKTYGVAYVTGPVGQTDKGYRYCGPKGCDAPAVASVTPAPPATVPACIDKGGSGQWTYGTAGGNYGPVCITRAMDVVPFRVTSDAPRTFQDVTVKSARNFLTTRTKSGSYVTISNLTARRMDLIVRERGFYVRGGSHDWLIEDVTIRCTGASDNIPGGIAIGSRGSIPNYNITIRRADISGCNSSPDPKKYANGDGIATERPDYGITIADSYIHDNADGCVDLKSSKTRLDNLTLARCNYGARLWAQGTAGTLRFSGNRKADIQIKPSTDWTIERVETDGPAIYVFADGAGGKLTIGSCNKPVKLAGAKANAVLGAGCI